MPRPSCHGYALVAIWSNGCGWEWTSMAYMIFRSMLEWLECERDYFSSGLTCTVYKVFETPSPLFRIFSRAIFTFLLGLSFGQFTHPLFKYPCINEKNINFALKIVGWGAPTTHTFWEGRGGSKNKYIFLISLFVFFPFCHNNDYVPEILET